MAAAGPSCLHPLVGERLANQCLLRNLDGRIVSRPEVEFIDARLKNEGYADGMGLGFGYTPPPVSGSVSIAPTLEWSSDINGGNPDKTLILNGLTFKGDPKLVEKKGVLAGVSAGLNGRYRYGEGRYLSYGLTGGYAYSPEHGMGVFRRGLHLCSLNQIGNSWYADLCLNAARVEKEITDDTTGTAGVTVSKIFGGGSGGALHQASLGLNRYGRQDEYAQTRLVLGFDTIHAFGLFTGLDLVLGESVGGNHLTTRRAATVSVGTYVDDKPLSLSLAYSEARGAKLFGVPRDENSWSVTATWPVWRSVSLSLGYRSADSTIDYYDSSGMTFGVQFARIPF